MAKHLAKCPKCGEKLTYESAVGDRIPCASCGAILKAPRKPRPTDELIGQTLGQYEITGLLGRGGMGSVYRGRQASLNRDVAIKVLSPGLAIDADFVERFRREAHAAAAVTHANIIEVHDIGKDGQRHYIVMELVDGETLADRLKRDGSLNAHDALPIFAEAAAALAAAHEKGILHRDIKPGNIMFTSRGRVKVADFGLAKRQGVDVSVTATGASVGTPLYMPPELAQGEPADARSDLYSLGATFYHALAGKPPFEGNTWTAVLLQHCEKPVPPLQKLAPDAPATLCRIIHKLLRKKPDERYGSAEELLEALGRVDVRSAPQGEKTVTSPAQLHHPSLDERRAGKKRKGRGGLIAGFVAAVAIAVILFLALRGKEEETQAKAPPKKAEAPTPPSKKPAVEPKKKAPAPAKKAPEPPRPDPDNVEPPKPEPKTTPKEDEAARKEAEEERQREAEAAGRAALAQAEAAYAEQSDKLWALLKERKYGDAAKLIEKLSARPEFKGAAKHVQADAEAVELVQEFWPAVEKGMSALKDKTLFINGAGGSVVGVKDGVITIKTAKGESKT
ncbi:serine/threonine protein kinase, partial [bacterium]|nr:serine/threonine protein kinase [bacterium]